MKLRDCGRPRVAAHFENGGGRIHAFAALDVTDEQGRGVAFPIDPMQVQTISFTALIPGHEGVMPGHARGWAELDYSEACPAAPPVRSPEIAFAILAPSQPARDAAPAADQELPHAR